MRHLILASLLLTSWITMGQSSVNTAAVITSDLIFSVGEIYVIPANEDESSSGVLGIVSQTEFGTLSAEEVAQNTISIFPNPTNGKIYFSGFSDDLGDIQIYDIAGRLLKKQSLLHNQLSIEEFPNGVYILQVDINRSFKIIKQ